MNEKILARKFEKVVKIVNEDGGMTMIEMMGFLRYCELRYIDEAHQQTLKNIQKTSASYEEVKRKRIGDMNV